MKHARIDYNRIQDPDNLIPENEPVFLLRGQDSLAPALVRQWATNLVLKGGSLAMAQMARDQADAMEAWQVSVRSKTPDLSVCPHEKCPTPEICRVQGCQYLRNR